MTANINTKIVVTLVGKDHAGIIAAVCSYFAENPSMEASIYCSERADYLNRVIGLSWEEIEEIELSAYAA